MMENKDVQQFLQTSLDSLLARATEIPTSQYDALRAVLLASDYAQTLLQKQPGLCTSTALQQSWSRRDYDEALSAELKEATSEASLHQVLRRFRHQGMFRILYRDVNGLAPIEESLRDLSYLAESCLSLTLEKLTEWLRERIAQPVDSTGTPLQLIVIAMGKLGGQELNFSSDIDLIFCHPDVAPEEERFFLRLAQSLIKALSETTDIGFVFRVDMRLRPFGDSGPLSIKTSALESYLQAQGRDWERYAYVKARPITGSDKDRARITAMISAFVYRRYVDYGVVQSLRELKASIDQASREKQKVDDIKVGVGGIREIEFITQAFQIILGGKTPALKTPRIYEAFDRLTHTSVFSEEDIAELKSHYNFYRVLENRIQMLRDEQTHSLPTAPLAQARLAASLGFADYPALLNNLKQRRDSVYQFFGQTIQDRHDSTHAPPKDSPALREDFDEEALAHCGFESPSRAHGLLHKLIKSMDNTGLAHKRLLKLLPSLFHQLQSSATPDETLARLCHILHAILRRSAYLSLLNENPKALALLTTLCERSLWVSEQIARHPLLLDEMLDARILYEKTGANSLEQKLLNATSHIQANDEEGLLNALGYFKEAQTLRLAASQVMQAREAQYVSEQMTQMATLILSRLTHSARSQRLTKTPEMKNIGFAIIGFGKLGSHDLSYDSDLDLVFLYQAPIETEQAAGEAEHFCTRLTQRILHLLSLQQHSGALYSIDVRLRPSGNAGPLVSTLSAFEHYQQQQAWTWEHQALVKARPICGDDMVMKAFNNIRFEILTTPRETQKLKQDVLNMRHKMIQEHKAPMPGMFDLKASRGGMIDIEFIVQLLVLAHGHKHPELCEHTQTVALLNELAAVTSEDKVVLQNLSTIYQAYAQQLHLQNLQKASPQVPEETVASEKAAVIAAWDLFFK